MPDFDLFNNFNWILIYTSISIFVQQIIPTLSLRYF